MVDQSPQEQAKTIILEKKVMEKNEVIAAQVRQSLSRRKITAFNLISSPGSGKTTLLEYTLSHYRGALSFAVIEGDQQTDRDSRRIKATGVPVVQINTITGCHLNAAQVLSGFEALPQQGFNVIMIENVGNLVCPASFDLGEHFKVVVLSVAEGEDKPIKYPLAFRLAAAVIITKVDLIPHLRFDLTACKTFIRQINPQAPILETSCYTGEGMPVWFQWLEKNSISG